MQNIQKKVYATTLFMVFTIFPFFCFTIFYHNDIKQSIPFQRNSEDNSYSTLPDSRIVLPNVLHDSDGDKIADTLSELLLRNTELAAKTPNALHYGR
ncbi:MAG: hypothetical protein ACW99L_18975, partial [Promethearchaeota archaeon]